MIGRAWLAALGLLVGCERGPELRQPVGVTESATTTLTGAEVPGARPDTPPRTTEPPGALEACAASAPVIELGFDSTVLDGAEDLALGRFAACFARSASPDDTVLVVGHADPSGAPDYNLSLGLARALAVKDRLVAHGLSPARIFVTSAGEVASAGAYAAGARRVEVLIRRGAVAEGSAPAP